MMQIGEDLNEQYCIDLIASGDRDNDGKLSFDEFIRMMAGGK